MTKLLCITARQQRTGVNDIGDIVGVFPDDWSFSEKEINDFNIVTVPEAKAEVESKIPEIKQIYKSTTTDWTDSPPESKHVWVDKNNEYRELIKNPKYKLRYDGGQVIDTVSACNDNAAVIEIIKGNE